MYCLSNFFLCVGKKTIKKRKIIIEIFGRYINNTYLYSVIKKIQK